MEDILEIGKMNIVEYYETISNEIKEIYIKSDILYYIESIKNEICHLNMSVSELARDMRQKAMVDIQNGIFRPLEYLIEIFHLDEFEVNCIIMALLPEMDRRFEELYAFLHKEGSMRLLSIELANKFYRQHENISNTKAYFTKESKLMKFFFHSVRKNEYADLSTLLKLRKRVIAFLLNGEWDNQELNQCLTKYVPNDMEMNMDVNDKVYEKMLHYYQKQKYGDENNSIFFYLYGPKGIGKKSKVQLFAKKFEKAIYFVDCKMFYKITMDEMKKRIDEIMFECIIGQAYICLDDDFDEDRLNDEVEEKLLYLIQKIKEYTDVVFFTSRNDRKMITKSSSMNAIMIRLEPLNLMECRYIWEQLSIDYHLDSTILIGDMANKFVFSPGQIKHILNTAKRISVWQQEEYISEELLRDCCYKEIEHNLGKKATKICPIYGWEDLILPCYQINTLHIACDQIKYRHIVYENWGFHKKINYGIGLSMIFTGSPGTGKTMASQVIAKDLGLELYKVELAAVVSKYIGETERNLNEIFEEAQKSQAILFFDEADVLFSKRTEVKDSNDKYSNMEAAFLLQKMEEYTGVSILATNYMQNIDDAFRRRIKFIIDFPLPELADRIKLWKSVFPKEMPLCHDVDLEYLAQTFEMSGSHIKNTAIHAAFLAASSGSSVTMSHIILAIKNEMTKNGKMLNKEDLGEYYMYLA